jgi:hypothetical protein
VCRVWVTIYFSRNLKESAGQEGVALTGGCV